MIENCPHCAVRLNIGPAQQEKINAALAALAEGKRLQLTCPSCRQPILLDKEGRVAAKIETKPANAAATSPGVLPDAPGPPDLSWLAEGMVSEKKMADDIPRLLCLAPAGTLRDTLAHAFEKLGYDVDHAETSEEAVAGMRFITYTAVALVEGFDGNKDPLTTDFHAYMAAMAMDRRRHIFYLVAGDRFHTLYDLEALTISANLTLNPREISRIDLILQKAMADRQHLFGPLIEAVREFK